MSADESSVEDYKVILLTAILRKMVLGSSRSIIGQFLNCHFGPWTNTATTRSQSSADNFKISVNIVVVRFYRILDCTLYTRHAELPLKHYWWPWKRWFYRFVCNGLILQSLIFLLFSQPKKYLLKNSFSRYSYLVWDVFEIF